MLLSDKYPFLTEYFENAINNDNAHISHSILFYGTDLTSQYTLALEIARLLNCTGDKSDDCNCLNCKWIREGTHPAVLTVSRKDSKPQDDDTKTVISVKQSEMIRNSLIVSSDYYRVFILCDRDDDGNIRGLNQFNLKEETANSLLKSIEEPDERVMFIFLTQDKNDLISTIVSRSQCFFVPSRERQEYNYELIQGIFTNYWEKKRADVFDISKKLCDIASKNSTKDLLEQIQNYMLVMLKSNPKNVCFVNDIKAVEKAKKECNVGMKNDVIFDELCLNLIK